MGLDGKQEVLSRSQRDRVSIGRADFVCSPVFRFVRNASRAVATHWSVVQPDGEGEVFYGADTEKRLAFGIGLNNRTPKPIDVTNNFGVSK